jgi:ABC-type Fe2+-enterobactin transport system substrate-binding protein
LDDDPIERIRAVSEKAGGEELKEEIERGHFVRAAQVAESIGLPRDELRDIQVKALWEMAAVGRNEPGTKRLAQEYGFSKQELRNLLEEYAENRRRKGDLKPLEPCYDAFTGTYLSFEGWMDFFFKKYDKIYVA